MWVHLGATNDYKRDSSKSFEGPLFSTANGFGRNNYVCQFYMNYTQVCQKTIHRNMCRFLMTHGFAREVEKRDGHNVVQMTEKVADGWHRRQRAYGTNEQVLQEEVSNKFPPPLSSPPVPPLLALPFPRPRLPSSLPSSFPSCSSH